MPKKRKQYRGALNPSEVADGINAAFENSRRLFYDAKLLFENSKYPSSVALSILSIEESGKASILRQISTTTEEKEVKEGWKRYRNHQAKNAHWISIDLMSRGARRLSEMKKIEDPESDHPEILDHIKQMAIYTDCLEDIEWSIPDMFVDKEVAAGLLKVTEVLSNHSECAEEHISLWIKHMQPVKNSPMDDQKRALLGWFQEMKDNGYMSEGVVNFEEFVDVGGEH